MNFLTCFHCSFHCSGLFSFIHFKEVNSSLWRVFTPAQCLQLQPVNPRRRSARMSGNLSQETTLYSPLECGIFLHNAFPIRFMCSTSNPGTMSCSGISTSSSFLHKNQTVFMGESQAFTLHGPHLQPPQQLRYFTLEVFDRLIFLGQILLFLLLLACAVFQLIRFVL